MNTTFTQHRFFSPSLCLALLLCFASAAHAQVASGGTFTLEQSVLAGGGATSTGTSATGTPLTLTGTIGQTTAGVVSRGGNRFAVRGGFWATNAPQPTAATAHIAGQVTTARGTPLGGIRVTLTGGAHTDAPLVIFTDADGNYVFPALATGETYVVTLTHKRFTFAPANQIIDLTADVTALNFTSASTRRRSLRDRR